MHFWCKLVDSKLLVLTIGVLICQSYKYSKLFHQKALCQFPIAVGTEGTQGEAHYMHSDYRKYCLFVTSRSEGINHLSDKEVELNDLIFLEKNVVLMF